MTTPHEWLTRMRKSFEKNKTVLTADYKYFTTPNVPATPQESTQRLCSPSRCVFESFDSMDSGACATELNHSSHDE
jgi:hypothetical protein